MATNRRKARTEIFNLLFETEFKQDEPREAIFELARENREFDADAYIHDVYFGVFAHLEEIDALIGRHANGWKVSRLTRVSRSILRLCVYELLYCPDIPASVSLNEAVELCKTFEEEKARPFVNGVLNGIKNEIVGARAEKPAEAQNEQPAVEQTEKPAEAQDEQPAGGQTEKPAEAQDEQPAGGQAADGAPARTDENADG